MAEPLEQVSAVPVTPFAGDGSIDEPALAAVVERIVAAGVRVVVPCGGTGEFSALTAAERDRVGRVAAEAAGAGTTVLVGVGGDAATAAAATREAARSGAHGVMVHALTDPYLTPDGIVRYFEHVAAAADGVIVPYLRGRVPSTSTLERVLGLPQVVAVKWATPDVMAFADFAARFGERVVPICGLAETWAPYFALAGGRGFTSGLVNVTCEPSLRLDAALRAGSWDEAMAVWRAVRPFEELRARHDAGNNVPAVKEAMQVVGLLDRADVRPPLAPLSGPDRDDLRRILLDLGLRVTDVLVTGASGGLGTALVDALVARGDRVLALDRVAPGRDDVRAAVVDAGDPAAVAGALTEAHAAGYRLRHVVAIAGGALPEEKTCPDLAELPLEVFQASVEHNLVTAWIVLQAALPYLREAEGDRSITVTSSTDALASYGLPAYAAAKAGLVGLVHALTGTLGADGIRINAIAPGDVPTPRNRREWAHVPGWYDRLREGIPLGRLATPAQMAQAYLALIDLDHVTGQTLVVDGGQTLSRPAGAAAGKEEG